MKGADKKRDKKSHLLVDFENVQKVDLAALPEGFRVTVFVGCGQKSIPFELVQAAQKWGVKLDWLKAEGGGANALDFHLAYYLGCLLTRRSKTVCFVLSRDTGFDPLLRHLKQKGLRCRRISSLSELQTESNPIPIMDADSNYARVVKSLKGKKSRPCQRKTLTNHILSIFQKKISAEEVERLIDLLFAEGKVGIKTNQTLSYAF